MSNTTTATCRHHDWERRLEVHNRLQRVIRVCSRCGREEICWSQLPPVRRRHRTAATGVAHASLSDTASFDPEI